MELFRKEVLLAKRPKLYGDVLIAQPLGYVFLSGILALFFILGGALAFLGEYTRSEQAMGHLVSTKGVVKIYPSRIGTVSFLNVDEGSFVSQGEKLATITLEQANIFGRSSQAQGVAALKEQTTLLENKFTLQEEQTKTKAEKLRNEKESLFREIVNVRHRINLQREITASANQIHDASNDLLSNGNLSRLEVGRRKQTLLSSQQTLNTLEQTQETLQYRIKTVEIDLVENDLDHQEAVNQINNELLMIEQRIIELESNRAYVLTAPVSGKTTSILTSLGRTVSSDIPLMTIIPDGGEIIAELFVPSKAAGFVRPGQEVRLTFEAFPFQSFGYVPAVITSVTSTILLPDETGAAFDVSGPVYRVTAELQSNRIKAGATAIELQPGMHLQATIVLERIRLIDKYLLPLKAWGDRL